jgi:hypothetical protein
MQLCDSRGISISAGKSNSEYLWIDYYLRNICCHLVIIMAKSPLVKKLENYVLCTLGAHINPINNSKRENIITFQPKPSTALVLIGIFTMWIPQKKTARPDAIDTRAQFALTCVESVIKHPDTIRIIPTIKLMVLY